MTIEKARLRHNNVLSIATLSADHNSAEAPRAVDRDLANPWVSDSVATQHLLADCGSALSISSLVLGNHNLSGCSISLQKSATGVGSWVTVDSFTPADDGHIARDFTNETERYWQLKIQNATVNPQVGEWWLCNGVTVFPQFIPGFDPGEKGQSAVVEQGPVATETREKYSFRKFRVKLNRTTQAFADQMVTIFKENGSKPFWFDWDGSGVPVFVRMSKPEIRIKGTGRGRVSLDISMEECLAAGAEYDSTEERDKRVNEPVFACKLELSNRPIFGRATGGSSTTLVDSGADFVDSGVQVGDRAYNETDDFYKDITSIGITALKTTSDISFESGDRYVIRANTWDDDPNIESLWLTQEQLWPGCMPVIKKISAIDKKIDFEKGTSIIGGLNLDLIEWQETSWLQKLLARKMWDGAKVHVYEGYKTGAALSASDLDFSGSYVVRKAVGTDLVNLRLDSLQGQLMKPAHKTTLLFHLNYLGTNRIEISVDGETLKIWEDDAAEPFVSLDLTSSAYDTVQKVRDALQTETELSCSVVETGQGSGVSSVINDLDRVHISRQDGLVINGLQTTYSGAPADAYYDLLAAIGIKDTEMDYYDIVRQMYWISDWYIEQRPSLEKDAFTVLGEIMKSCGGWVRTGQKRDILGTHNGGNDSTTLDDDTADFVKWGVAVGDTVNNLTDGCTGVITEITSSIKITIGGGLSGGTDNDFDTDDEYEIVASPREVFSCRIMAPPIPAEVSEILTKDHIIDGGLSVNHNTEGYHDRCEIKYDYNPVEEKFMGKVVVIDPEKDYYAQDDEDKIPGRTMKIKAPWIKGAGASVQAGVLGERRLYWQRRNRYRVKVVVLLNRSHIEPADTILLTHDAMPSEDGEGATARKMLVIRKQINHDIKSRRMTLEITDAHFQGEAPFIISPEGTSDWDSATDQEENDFGFITDEKGLMPDGTTEGKVLY
jgi:hypothetical protein